MMLKKLTKKKNILKALIITIAAGIAFWLFWVLRLSGESMPIGHTIGLSGGNFTPAIGKIREITISGTIDEPIELQLSKS